MTINTNLTIHQRAKIFTAVADNIPEDPATIAIFEAILFPNFDEDEGTFFVSKEALSSLIGGPTEFDLREVESALGDCARQVLKSLGFQHSSGRIWSNGTNGSRVPVPCTLLSDYLQEWSQFA